MCVKNSLCSLYYTDEQVVIAEDEDNLNYMVRKLHEDYEQLDCRKRRMYQRIFR